MSFNMFRFAAAVRLSNLAVLLVRSLRPTDSWNAEATLQALSPESIILTCLNSLLSISFPSPAFFCDPGIQVGLLHPGFRVQHVGSQGFPRWRTPPRHDGSRLATHLCPQIATAKLSGLVYFLEVSSRACCFAALGLGVFRVRRNKHNLLIVFGQEYL